MTLTAPSTSIVVGAEVPITLSTTNIPDNDTSCDGVSSSGGVLSIVGPLASQGTAVVSPPATTTLSVTCFDAAGVSASASITIKVRSPSAPSVTLTADRTTIANGGTANISLLTTNVPDAADVPGGDNCTGSTTTASGSTEFGTVANRGTMPVQPHETTLYTVVCPNDSPTKTSASMLVTVAGSPPFPYSGPSVFLSAPTNIIDVGGSVPITLATTNVPNNDVSCAAVYSANGIATNAGPVASHGTIPVSPTSTTTYSATCFDANGASASGSITIVVRAGPATTLAVATQPTTSQSRAVFGSAVDVALHDAFGNSVAQSGIPVTAAIASGAGTLSGTTSVSTDPSGHALFTNLIIQGTAGPFSLRFTAPGKAPATSGVITLAAGTPVTVVFLQHPTPVVVNAVIAPAVTVAVHDADHNVVTTWGSPITVDIFPGLGAPGAVLSGTKTASVVAGVATFADLSIDRVGSLYALHAQTAGFGNGSAYFSVLTAAPASLTIVSGNNQVWPNDVPGPQPQLTVVVKDALGRPVPFVAVSFDGGPGVFMGSPDGPTNGAGISSASMVITGPGNVFSATASVPGLPSVVFTVRQIAFAPGLTTCNLTSTHDAYCWGDNSHGTVGDGTFSDRSTPTPVAGGLKFSSLASGSSTHRCGLTATGHAYCWGRNAFGQLGDNTTVDRAQPVAVQGGLTFTKLATSSNTTCGLATDLKVFCWGWSGYGMLGDVDWTIRPTPTQVFTAGKVFSDIVVLSEYACGLEASGTVDCWGRTPNGMQAFATAVPGAPDFIGITAGLQHTCGLTAAGAAYCWATLTNFGVIGDGTSQQRTSPTLVAGGLTFTELRASGFTTCGRTSTNAMYCWGEGGQDYVGLPGGQIGDGSLLNRLAPSPVSGGIAFSRILNGGLDHTCAVSAQGQPFCWGGNTSGSLGIGGGGLSSTPVPVNWVEGTPGEPQSLIVAGGTNGSAPVGSAVATAPSVVVRDFANNPVSGVTVTFAVGPSSGSATGLSAVTDASGIARVGGWTLGSVGTNTLTATLAGVGQVVFVATGR